MVKNLVSQTWFRLQNWTWYTLDILLCEWWTCFFPVYLCRICQTMQKTWDTDLKRVTFSKRLRWEPKHFTCFTRTCASVTINRTDQQNFILKLALRCKRGNFSNMLQRQTVTQMPDTVAQSLGRLSILRSHLVPLSCHRPVPPLIVRIRTSTDWVMALWCLEEPRVSFL